MSAPFDFFEYKDNELHAEGVPLSRIASEIGTPAYVYSSQAFLAPLREMQKALSDIDHMICFAVKSNSNIAVLKLLKDAGAGMDLVSGGELFRAIKAGVTPDRIVFSGVGKTPEEMVQALKAGIYSFNVESVAELATLSEVATKLGKRAPVALRFNPDVDAKTHPYISTGLKKNKFGVERREIQEIAENLDQYPGIDIKGLSIHIGSQLLSLSPLNDAFAKTRQLADKLNDLLPSRLEFVDLGGGVGITYKNEKPPKLLDYCKLIRKHFAKSRMKVLIEPGRSIAGNAGVLLTEVLYLKQRGKKDFMIVDAAMNDLMRPSLYSSYHGVVPVKEPGKKAATRKTDIVGPVCESADCFGTDRPLPVGTQSGDHLAILSAGAYGFSMSSNYNTRPRPPEILVEGHRYRVIREKESLLDLVRGEKL